MKTVLWLLLALNGLAAAVWLAGFSVPPKPVAELTIPAPSAKPLQLLSELPALPPRLDTLPADYGVPPDAPEEGGLPPAQPPAVEVPGSPAPVAEPQVPQNAPLPVASSPAPDATAAKETPMPTPPDKAATAKPPVLADPEPPVDATATPVTTGLPVGDGTACYRTAALAGDVYEAAGTALREAGLGEPTLQPQDRARPRHWVYWAGAADELTSIEERLKAAGVRDWYRLRTDDGMLRISLGVYGQADGARRRQRELAAKAIQTQISEHYTPQARLRWTFTAQPATVDAVKDRLQGQGVRVEACP